MDNITKVSVLVPTCNRPMALAVCIDRIRKEIECIGGCAVEILIGDDGGAAEAFPKGIPDGTRIIEGPLKGPAANRNSLVSSAAGELLIFLDDDCIPDKYLLRAYISAAEDNPTADLFEGLISVDREPQLAYEEAPFNETGGVLWSANIAARAEKLKSICGFDESYPFASMEDIDFRIRAQKSGLAIKWVPTAKVMHPLEIRTDKRRLLKHIYSVLLFTQKHPDQLKQVKNSHSFIGAARFLKQRVIKRRLIQPFKAYLFVWHSWMMMLSIRLALRNEHRRDKAMLNIRKKMGLPASS